MKVDISDPSPKRSVEERNLLVDEYRLYAEKVVWLMIHRMGLPEREFDELRSAAYIGLIDAADRFTGEHDSSFRTYAFYRIRGAIIDNIRRMTGARGRRYRKAKALEAAESIKESGFNGYGGNSKKNLSDDDELSAMLDFASKAILINKLSNSGTTDTLLNLPDNAPSAEDVISTHEASDQLRRFVAELPETERLVIEAYYFRDLSFVETAEEVVGASKSWVSRVHARAISRLHERMMTDETKKHS